MFTAHLTKLLSEPRYEKPTRIVEQMLKSAGKFGFRPEYQEFFPDSSDCDESAVLKRALSCPTRIRVSRGQLYTTS
jgi:hypothetical protein